MIRLPLRGLAVALSLVFAIQVAAQDEMRLDLERQSLTGTHRHYAQFIDGIRVIGGGRSETLLPGGLLRVDYLRSAAEPQTRGVAASMRSPRDLAGAELVYVNLGGRPHAAWRRIESVRALEPHARYYDAETHELLRDEPLYFSSTVKGRVFDVNPVAKLNAPWLRDQNGSASAVPAEAYSLTDMDVVSTSGILYGDNVQIVDVQEPFTPHADAAQPLLFDRSQPQFAEVNAYFQIDRAQRYLQSLGYIGSRQIVSYSLPVDPHAANGTDNSYYLTGSLPGHGTLYFGDGGTPDAEDSDIVLHEFMHAVHDWIIPGALNGTISSQARAVSEGLGDYWAFSSTYAATTASGRDPFCIGDWDARCGGDDPSRKCGYADGADCLRRVDSSKTIADYVNSETPGTEHLNGEIWSSALREIFMTLGGRYGAAEGKRVTDTLVVESLFGLPPDPTFATVANSMIAADRLLRGGADVDVICGAMASRGLLNDCGSVPRGEGTLIQSGDQALAIPDGSGAVTAKITIADTRPISSLAVRVDIAHPSRGDLVITLRSPDGKSLKLKDSSPIDRTSGVHATFGIDAAPVDSLSAFIGMPATGTWTLTVSDVYSGDAGVLESWDLRIGFVGDASFAQRPSPAAGTIIVPVAGHAFGSFRSSFTSDLFLLDRGTHEAQATLVFTPTGADGSTTFAAARVTIASGQMVALRDILPAVFGMSGTGTIAIDPAGAELVASCTAVNTIDDSVLTQTIDTASPADAIAAGDSPLELFPIAPNPGWRRNAGFVETSGARGTVRLVVRTLAGDPVTTIDTTIEPFSHVQVPVPLPDSTPTLVGSVSVISGGAHVLAYLSMVENRSGDAMTVLGRRALTTASQMIVPVVASKLGVGGAWRTEMWWANLTPAEDHVGDVPVLQMTFYPSTSAAPIHSMPAGMYGSYVSDTLYADFVQRDGAFGYLELLIPPKGFVMTRAYAPFAGSSSIVVGEKIQPESISNAIGPGGVADAMPVERSFFYRTNFGITEVTGAPVEVRVSLIAASGDLLARTVVSVPGHQNVQLPVSSLYAGEVHGGRLHFEVMNGPGRIFAYASVVSVENSPFFVLAR